jgi:glucose-1-phosphate thymidylyltransferase
MIYKVIRTLTSSGIKDIAIVLGGEGVGDFIRLLGDGSEFGATFSYVYQQKAGGIAEALYLTEKIVKGHKIAVILGDNIFEESFESEFNAFQDIQENNCCLFLKEVPDPERFGVAELNDDLTIKQIEEKPKLPKTHYAVTGLYLYDESLFDVIRDVIKEIGYSSRGELEITDVNNYFLRRGKTKSVIIRGFWSDAGTFDTLLKSSNFIQSLKKK